MRRERNGRENDKIRTKAKRRERIKGKRKEEIEEKRAKDKGLIFEGHSRDTRIRVFRY